jgi:hypothetical protein
MTVTWLVLTSPTNPKKYDATKTSASVVSLNEMTKRKFLSIADNFYDFGWLPKFA